MRLAVARVPQLAYVRTLTMLNMHPAATAESRCGDVGFGRSCRQATPSAVALDRIRRRERHSMEPNATHRSLWLVDPTRAFLPCRAGSPATSPSITSGTPCARASASSFRTRRSASSPPSSSTCCRAAAAPSSCGVAASRCGTFRRVCAGQNAAEKKSQNQSAVVPCSTRCLDCGSSALVVCWSRAFCGPYPKEGGRQTRQNNSYGSLRMSRRFY